MIFQLKQNLRHFLEKKMLKLTLQKDRAIGGEGSPSCSIATAPIGSNPRESFPIYGRFLTDIAESLIITTVIV